MTTLEKIIEMVERDLPGWGWLVRNNRQAGESGGYFANITSPDFKALHVVTTHGVRSGHEGVRFPAEAATKEGALFAAYADAWAAVEAGRVPRC